MDYGKLRTFTAKKAGRKCDYCVEDIEVDTFAFSLYTRLKRGYIFTNLHITCLLPYVATREEKRSKRELPPKKERRITPKDPERTKLLQRRNYLIKCLLGSRDRGQILFWVDELTRLNGKLGPLNPAKNVRRPKAHTIKLMDIIGWANSSQSWEERFGTDEEVY